MKYLITHSQFEFLTEGLSFEDLKKRFDYHLNLDKKHPKAYSFQNYNLIKEYQKVLDPIFKYTLKQHPIPGVETFTVATVVPRKFVHGPRVEIICSPILGESETEMNQEEFDKKIKEFENEVNKVMRYSSLDKYYPEPSVKNISVYVTLLTTHLKRGAVMESGVWEDNFFVRRGDMRYVITENRLENVRKSYLDRLKFFFVNSYTIIFSYNVDGEHMVMEFNENDRRLWIDSHFVSQYYGMFGFDDKKEAALYIADWFELKFDKAVKSVFFGPET